MAFGTGVGELAGLSPGLGEVLADGDDVGLVEGFAAGEPEGLTVTSGTTTALEVLAGVAGCSLLTGIWLETGEGLDFAHLHSSDRA